MPYCELRRDKAKAEDEKYSNIVTDVGSTSSKTL